MKGFFNLSIGDEVQRKRTESAETDAESPTGYKYIKEDSLKKHLQPLTPAALYTRISSGRQDVPTRR